MGYLSSFFKLINVDNIFNIKKTLNPHKTTQSTDIAIKLLKEIVDIFPVFICRFCN